MSFYTALTGLNGSSADISATSNNIANVGTTGFKRSRVEFGDIFATSPLQNSSSSLGSGTILKGVKQQFTQGNIASSLNALDLAISGQGFFALKPSLTSAQTVYTRNGSLNVNNDRYVVDSAGQYLLTYPVNEDGSVTAKDLDSAVPLQLPVTSGDPQATSNIKLGVNVPAASEVVTERAAFADGYQFDPNNSATFTNSTSITIFDDLGNPTIATVYFIKTQAASAQDPTNKYDTRLVINDTIIDPDLVSAVDDAGNQMFIDRFGRQTTTVPDDNYFLEGKGSALYKLDDLQTLIPSQPASIQSEQTSFDFGEEGDKLVEIVTDPMQFNATREAGTSGDVYWGKDFLLVNVDDSDQPVSIDIRPGRYNATQLAAEVERAINTAYGDDKKVQVVQNVDDVLTIDLQRVNADGTTQDLDTPITVNLLGTDSYITENIADFDISGASPDFTREEFLAHTQVRINEALNEYARTDSGATALGVSNIQFTRSIGDKLDSIYEHNQVVTLDRFGKSIDLTITPGTTSASNEFKFILKASGETDVEISSGALSAASTATTIATALAADTDVSASSSEYVVSSAAGVLSITRPDGKSFTVERSGKVGVDFPSDATVTAGTVDILNEAVGTTEVQNVTIPNAATLSSNPLSSSFVLGGVTIDASSVTSLAGLVTAITGDSDYASQDFTVAANANGTSLDLTFKQNFNETAVTATNGGVAMTVTEATAGVADFVTASDDNVPSQYMVHSYFGNRPQLSVYTTREALSASSGENFIEYTATQNKLKIYADDISGFAVGDTIRLSGNFADGDNNGALLNGRTFEIITSTTVANGRDYVEVSTSGLTLSDNDFEIGYDASVDIYALANESTTVEAFFEGSSPVYEGSNENYSSKRIVVREISSYDTNLGGFVATSAAFSNSGTDLADLGLDALSASTTSANSTKDWVDEKDPSIKVGFDAINQRLQFTVDRTVLGSGTDSNFNSFSISGSSTAETKNNLGIQSSDDAQQVLIRGGEVLYGDTFVADGEEIQTNDKRYGISVEYNSDTKTFSFGSGTTGEQIDADGALGVTENQKNSNIQIGRYNINPADGSAFKTYTLDSTIIGSGDNQLMGVGATKTDIIFSAGRGLRSAAAIATGASANEPLSNVFQLSAQTGENVFNVSVNGINGVIRVPSGSYVGTTLAEVLETRINQISDPITGDAIGGVQVQYSAANNNFTFTTGTTGETSTIKVRGAARLGLDDVALGVGSVPEIYNLVQATNADGVALYVNAEGEIVESPPENLVSGYYPLYIDEGELTFDKTGRLISPKNLVHYEKQEEGFSIALDVDFSASTQFAQPFSVQTVEQDGFTSGRLDGLEIDSSGTIRANYTNGQNNPLGKIVVANFNNQNGLKQIGNATYVETAVSGTPQVGEAGAEGFGNILSGSLERSNVDITEELVNLITAQRNFQASAKAIETTTGLTQTIINIRM